MRAKSESFPNQSSHDYSFERYASRPANSSLVRRDRYYSGNACVRLVGPITRGRDPHSISTGQNVVASLSTRAR